MTRKNGHLVRFRNLFHNFFPGTTPGPIFLGTIIDSACGLWQDTCGAKGSCWIYKKFDLGIRIMIWWICLKILALIFLSLAVKLYKPPKDHVATKTISSNGLVKEKSEKPEFTKF